MATKAELEQALSELNTDAAVFEVADEVDVPPAHPRLREIPSAVLYDGPRLVVWCQENGMRPTWWEIESERRRRQETRANGRGGRRR
ncbi:hypothetical protein [Terrabacter terrigena]|uniref:Thioredoxin n=1 Tax=Terrabacter terrigena TaxID=574718 RepID=A0ABW3N111_9MICO